MCVHSQTPGGTCPSASCLATPLQRSTYVYILINNWISTNTSGSHCLKNLLRVENYIIFTLHAGNVRLRCGEIVKTHQKRANSLNHAFNERAVGVIAPKSMCLCSCWRQIFRAHDVKMMWLTTRSQMQFWVYVDVTYFLCSQYHKSPDPAGEGCKWNGRHLRYFVRPVAQDLKPLK